MYSAKAVGATSSEGILAVWLMSWSNHCTRRYNFQVNQCYGRGGVEFTERRIAAYFDDLTWSVVLQSLINDANRRRWRTKLAGGSRDPGQDALALPTGIVVQYVRCTPSAWPTAYTSGWNSAGGAQGGFKKLRWGTMGWVCGEAGPPIPPQKLNFFTRNDVFWQIPSEIFFRILPSALERSENIRRRIVMKLIRPFKQIIGCIWR